MEGVSVEFEAKSARDGAWYQNIIISHTSIIVPSLVMCYRILTFHKDVFTLAELLLKLLHYLYHPCCNSKSLPNVPS